MYRYQRGFTFIELIAVIIVLGVISVTAIPRFSNAGASSLAGRDDLVAALFYAQQIAMARDSQATNAVQLQINAAGNQVSVVQTIAPTNLYAVTMPQGVTIAPVSTTLNYTKLGSTAATNFTVSSTDGSSAQVTLEATGYAR